jgi:hypothetical protein
VVNSDEEHRRISVAQGVRELAGTAVGLFQWKKLGLVRSVSCGGSRRCC